MKNVFDKTNNKLLSITSVVLVNYITKTPFSKAFWN